MGQISLGSATTDTGQNAVGYFDYSCFKFTATEDMTVDSVDIYVSTKSGLASSVVARIYSDNAGIPTTQQGGDSGGQSSFTAGATSTFTWSSNKPSLTGSTVYWVVFYVDTTNYIRIGETTAASPSIWKRHETTLASVTEPGAPSNVATANIKINYTPSTVSYTATPGALNLSTSTAAQDAYLYPTVLSLGGTFQFPTPTTTGGSSGGNPDYTTGTIVNGSGGLGSQYIYGDKPELPTLIRDKEQYSYARVKDPRSY